MSTTLAPQSVPKIPRRLGPVLFALLMSASLSGVVSASLTAVNTRIDTGFVSRWLHAYSLAWSFAFPAETLVAPRMRALVDRVTA